jgi:dienelactone hydrolase
MAQLTPTVLERLSRCATSIPISGMVAGATVEVKVAGTAHAFTATGGTQAITVPPLVAADVVRARQDDGGGFTPWSPKVVVEDAAVPPVAAPLLPSQVGACSQCVRVEGLVPGCDVELGWGGAVVGTAAANRHGVACVSVKLRRSDKEEPLTARMRVCGADGPFGTTPIVVDQSLGAPAVGEPLFGCQRTVPLGQLRPGAKTRLETDTGTFLGWICNCWTAVNVNVLHALVPSERVHAQQYWDGEACEDQGPFSGWRRVDPPDERIRPEVLAPVVAGDQIIRVDNQVVGADLVVLVRHDPAMPESRFGPRPAGEEPEVALNAPLVAGQQVAVEQHLCGHVEVSDWVRVLAPPPVVLAPIVLPPLYACGGAVQVSGLHPGALVRLFQNGISCGIAWAGLASSVAVAVAPALVAGSEVTARQWVGGVHGPESDPVHVVGGGVPHAPRILAPVAFGDTEVVVSGVTPGSLVSVWSGTTLLGERYAAESLVRAAISPLSGTVFARAQLCAEGRTGPRLVPITAPHAPGSEEGVGELDVDYGTVAVPVRSVPGAPDDGGFESPVRGRLYFPADGDGNLAPSATPRPLVVIAHGYWMNDEEDQSHLGYAWLARHLAQWGMFALSIDLATVNVKTGPVGGATQQTARAEVILVAAERTLAAPGLKGHADPARVGLVGHSMSGEGVFVAKEMSVQRAAGVVVRGVVSLAPTNWRPDVSLTDCHYLQLHGSLDYLLDGVTIGFLGFLGPRLFDRAWRHRTHAWIEGARHQGWNPNWWNSMAGGEGSRPPIDGSLVPDDQARIGRALINAFFQDALFDRTEYRGYLEGLVEDGDVRPYAVHMQHRGVMASVLDDMGDADAPLNLAAELPIDKTQNRQGGAVTAAGGGVDVWQDHAQSELDHCSQATIASDLAWSARDVTYRSLLPGLSGSPTAELVLRAGVRFDEDAGGAPDETWNLVGLDVDLLVELESPSGTATVRLGSAAAIPYPLPAVSVLSVPRTIRLPLDAFTAVEPAFDPSAITAITLRPAGAATGRILLDEVELAP